MTKTKTPATVDDFVDSIKTETPTKSEVNSTIRIFSISVIASLIAMLIVFVLIRPVFELAWPWLKNSSSQHLNGIVNRWVQNAALGDRNWVTASFAIIYFTLPITFALPLAIFLTAKINLQKNKDKKKPAKLVQKKREKIALIFMWIMVPFVGYGGLKSAGSIYYDIQLNASFSQRAITLAPVLSEQEEEELYADWATMVSKDDYDEINSKMEKFAQEREIILPKLLLE